MDTIGFAVLGAGTVGSAVLEHYSVHRSALEREAGCHLQLMFVLVRDVDKERQPWIPHEVLTPDLNEIISHPGVGVIVSVLGDHEREYWAIKMALEAGKRVVTANKFVVAWHGPELYAIARKTGGELFIEAAVCGAIQVVDNLLTRYRGNRIRKVSGIMNGTTNYIASEMAQGASYEVALARAQQLGYAEPDPTADVSGADAACKIAILASLATDQYLDPSRLHVEGIEHVTPQDVRYAKEFDYTIKLIATAELTMAGVQAWVGPTLVDNEHPLAGVTGVKNAVMIQADPIGDVLLQGDGAGGGATAASIWADTLNAASHIVKRGYVQPMPSLATPVPLIPFDRVCNWHYIRLVIRDGVGSLHDVLGVLKKHGISVFQDRQSKRRMNRAEGLAEVVIMTDEGREGSIREALDDIKTLDVFVRLGSVMRVLETGFQDVDLSVDD